jgi:transcription elongation factor Elf1
MKITRKSDKVKLIKAPSLQGKAWCPNCNERLYEIKGDTLNLMCHSCGHHVPIKAVKFPTQLTQIDSQPSVVVQNKNARRGIKPRPRNPIEQELTNAGFQVIDSDWRDRKHEHGS